MLSKTQKRIAIIAFFLGLNLALGAYFLTEAKIALPEPVLQVLSRLGVLPENSVSYDLVLNSIDEEPDLNVVSLAAEINHYRQNQGAPRLSIEPKLNAAAEELLQVAATNGYNAEIKFESDALETALKNSGYSYEWVSHNALVGPLSAKAVMTAWLSDEQQLTAIENDEFTDIGMATTVTQGDNGRPVGVVIQLLGKPSQVTSAQLKATARRTPDPIREIPDVEVITALNEYRATHGRRPLQVNEHLCRYAEKRAQDLVAYGGLDGHEGFKKDFEDPANPPVGIADYNQGRKIGENLAFQYCKNMQTGDSFVAETGTALIEWCFDSSTKGHKEAQLSSDFRNVCVRHAENMYVVIFGE